MNTFVVTCPQSGPHEPKIVVRQIDQVLKRSCFIKTRIEHIRVCIHRIRKGVHGSSHWQREPAASSRWRKVRERLLLLWGHWRSWVFATAKGLDKIWETELTSSL